MNEIYVVFAIVLLAIFVDKHIALLAALFALALRKSKAQLAHGARDIVFLVVWKPGYHTIGDWTPYWALCVFMAQQYPDIQFTFETWFPGECNQMFTAYDQNYCRSVSTKQHNFPNIKARVVNTHPDEAPAEFERLMQLGPVIASGEVDDYWEDLFPDRPRPPYISLNGDIVGARGARQSFSFISPVFKDFRARGEKARGSFLPPLDSLQPLPKHVEAFLNTKKKKIAMLASMEVDANILARAANDLIQNNADVVVLIRVLTPQLAKLAGDLQQSPRLLATDAYIEFGKVAEIVDVCASSFGHGSVMWPAVWGKPQARIPQYGTKAFDKQHFLSTLQKEGVASTQNDLGTAVQDILDNFDSFDAAAKALQAKILETDVGEQYLRDRSSASQGLHAASQLVWSLL